MQNANIPDLMLYGNEKIKQIFIDALLASYEHSCQIFNPEKGYNRDISDNSFMQTVDEILADKKYHHITILYRDIVNEHYDLQHWEFGMCSHKLYLNICVKPDLAEVIFANHNLKPINH